MKAYRKGAVAVLAVAALAMSACSSAGSNSSTGGTKAGNSNKSALANYNPQARDNIKDGGTFTTAIGEITPQLNVWHSDMTSDTRRVWSWFNPVLITYSPDGNEYRPDKNYLTDVKSEVKGGKTVVTYKVHPKAKFNDGTDIDYTAFEAAWKACGEVSEESAKQYACNSTDGLNKIESVAKGADAKEVVVTFKSEYAWWQGLFNNVLHPKALDPETFSKGYTNGQYHPEWGAGPFKVQKFDAQEGTVVFVPNELWWGDKPKLEQRVLKVLESTATINAFKAGTLDAAAVGNKDLLAQVRDMSNIEIRRGNLPANYLFTLNSASDKLKDKTVRQAVMTAIDRKAVADIRFQGLDYSEELPGSFSLFPYQKGYKDNFSSVVQYDVAKANKLLDDAGWAKGSDGVRAKDGVQLSLNYPIFGDLALTKSMAQAVQAMLKGVGVQVNVNQKPSSEFSKVMKAKDFDMVLSGFLSTDPFGVAYFCQIYCSNSTLNKSATGTKEFDEKIRAMEQIGSASEQIAKSNEIESEALGTFGIMPMFNGAEIVAVKKGLANYGASVFFVSPIQDVGWQK